MMMNEKNAEKEAIKALITALMQSQGSEEEAEESSEEPGEYASTRDQYDVEPEEIEADLYDDEQDIDADALDTQMEADDEMEEADDGDLSLRELVAQFMNNRPDPFEDKKGMAMMAALPPKKAMEIEIIKTASKMPKKKRANKKRGY